MEIGILGVVVGILLGLAGAGSGILSVPLLVLCLNLPIAQAVPIAFLAVAVAATFGTILDLKKGAVNFRLALMIGMVGAFAAPAGELVAHNLPDKLLSVVFSFLLLLVCYRNLVPAKSEKFSLAPIDHDEPQEHQAVDRPLDGEAIGALMGFGAVAGLLSGLLGVGGGFAIVPALRRHTGLSSEGIAATTLAVVAIIASAAVAVSVATAQMNFSIAPTFCAFALAGTVAGRALTGLLKGYQFQKYLAPLFFLTALGMAANSILGK